MSVIGIDLGGTNIAAGLVDERGVIVARTRVGTDRAGGADAICNQIVSCCDALCRAGDISPARVAGVGVACPGWVNADSGVIHSSANLPFDQYRLTGELERRFGRPSRADNDANCAALGEAIFGAAKGQQNVLLITVGTGIGAGVIHRGRLISGPGATELGHTVLVMGGRQCGCGRLGCSETYTSASALIAQAGEAAAQCPDSLLNQAPINGEAIFSAAARGDSAAKAVLDGYFVCFAEMLMNFVNTFRPGLILVGGGIADAGEEAFFAPLRERLAGVARANVYGVGMPDIRRAALGNDAGILGAAALFFEGEGSL